MCVRRGLGESLCQGPVAMPETASHGLAGVSQPLMQNMAPVQQEGDGGASRRSSCSTHHLPGEGTSWLTLNCSMPLPPAQQRGKAGLLWRGPGHQCPSSAIVQPLCLFSWLPAPPSLHSLLSPPGSSRSLENALKG